MKNLTFYNDDVTSAMGGMSYCSGLTCTPPLEVNLPKLPAFFILFFSFLYLASFLAAFSVISLAFFSRISFLEAFSDSQRLMVAWSAFSTRGLSFSEAVRKSISS